jgi:hypothetical protein
MTESTNKDAGQVAGERHARRGEAFWRELFTQWRASGLGVRAFCQQRGIAISMFGLWRAKLSRKAHSSAALPAAMTADAVLIEAQSDKPSLAMPAASVPAGDVSAGVPHDGVALTLGGVRIELGGVHAERIVRFVLDQLRGAQC